MSTEPVGQGGQTVETLRLRKIQQPSEIGRLLESYIARADILPKGSYQIHQAREVPSELRSVLNQANEQGRAWSCWTQGFRTWLFTCEMSLPLSRERGAPVLQVNLYGDDGGLQDSANMMTDQSGKWRRCAD